jgi:hypothetical protein
MELGGRKVSVRGAGGNRAGEIRITRLLRNPKVTSDEMLTVAAARTAQRCLGQDVLVIQDTTVIRSEGGGGDYLHASIALDAADGAILGLVGGCFLQRTSGRKQARKRLPIEEKESFRWLEGAEEAASVGAGAARVTVIADREGDIYEAFALRPHGIDLLIRAAQDRSLDDGELLFAALDALPQAGTAELGLPAGPGRRARETKVGLRFATMMLAKPDRLPAASLPGAVEMQLIDVREIDPPAGVPAIHWRLLTTRVVQSEAEAWAVVDLYRKRWAIEQLFRTLKTQGFDIEAIRIEDSQPRNKLITATLIAAVAIQQLVHGRDGHQGHLRPCTDVFEPEDIPLLEAWCAKLEGKTERQKNPHPKGSLAYAAWVCGRLGGWTGYYGQAGPIVMLRGWLEFKASKRTKNLLDEMRVV